MELRASQPPGTSEQPVFSVGDRQSKRDLGVVRLVLSLLFVLALLSSFLVVVQSW